MSTEQTLLQYLWQRSQPRPMQGPPAGGEDLWQEAIMLIEQLGRGMEETIRYLYTERPGLPQFEEWAKAKANTGGNEERLDGDVLTDEDLSFWNANGYIVLRNAVTQQQAADAADAIWQHLGASPADPDTWYKSHEDLRGLMLTFYHHPALEANRKSPRVRRAFEQLYGTNDIHRNMDKVSFNPPETADHKFMGSALHWDVSLQLPIPFKLQGLLYLTDTDTTNGAFHCVPGFHHTIGEWMNSLPAGVNPRDEAVKILKAVPITGNAGDFIIWHQALPHCATPNLGSTPRLVQYFTYLQPAIKSQEVWV